MSAVSQNEAREQIVAGLRELGAQLVADQGDVIREGSKIKLPFGWSLKQGWETIRRLAQEEEQVTDFVHTTRYRPLDTAYNALEVVRELFGTFFTKANFWDDDEVVEFQIGNNETVQIPIGSWFEIPGVCEAAHMPDSTMHIKFGSIGDSEAGELGQVTVKGPKGLRDLVSELFHQIDARLEEASLYRGKYIDGRETPQFMDAGNITGESIILNEEIQRTLQAKVMMPIRHTEAMKAQGYPVKRAVLLEGDFGTGKTITMQWAASEAIRAGWTAIHVKPGRDDLFKAIQFAGLYSPCLIICEDVDTIGGHDQDPQFMSRVLEAFDGATAKGAEIVVMLTTNHIDRIEKGLLRPGRFDSIVSFGAPDDTCITRLIELYTPRLGGVEDITPVVEAMRGWTPAFIQAACQIAGEFNMARNDGKLVGSISAEDLLFAAKSYEAHRLVQERAKVSEPKITLDSLLREIVGGEAERTTSVAIGATVTAAQTVAGIVNENVDDRVQRAISDNEDEHNQTRQHVVDVARGDY